MTRIRDWRLFCTLWVGLGFTSSVLKIYRIFDKRNSMKAKGTPSTWIIPCYNEANRFPYDRYVAFLQSRPTAQLLFVDDGSKDGTAQRIEQLQEQFPHAVSLIVLSQNMGKAEAVRQGILQALENPQTERLGYVDADLSTSLEEACSLEKKLSQNSQFIFGSRILKLDNTIERKWHRFVIGRLVATAISGVLGIEVYDTQCGCKVMSRAWAVTAFEKPFISRWLFDVELFFRLMQQYGKKTFLQQSHEIPLQQWIDTADSRVSWSYGLKLWWDLFYIWKTYR